MKASEIKSAIAEWRKNFSLLASDSVREAKLYVSLDGRYMVLSGPNAIYSGTDEDEAIKAYLNG